MTVNSDNSNSAFNMGNRPFIIIAPGLGPQFGGPAFNIGTFTAEALMQLQRYAPQAAQAQVTEAIVPAATEPTPIAQAANTPNQKQEDVIAPRRGHATKDAPNMGEVAAARPSVFTRIGDRVQEKKSVHDRLVFPADYNNQAARRSRNRRAARPSHIA